MKTHSILGRVYPVLVFIVLTCVALNAQPAPSFPAIEAVDLNKMELTIPGDFRSQQNIVLFSYQRDHSDSIEQWLTYFQELADASKNGFLATHPIYSVMLIDDVAPWISRLISGGLRSGFPEQDRWSGIVIFQEREPILATYNLPEEDGEPLVLVVNRNGTAYLLADKPFGSAAIKQFNANLARYTNRS